MKNFKSFLILGLILLLGNTAFSQVSSDYDKSTDFTKFKTYSFSGWEKNTDQKLSKFDKKRILDAFKNELDARGMTYVETGGDLAISLYLVLSKESSVTAYTDYNTYMGFRGRRWGWGGGITSGTANTSFDQQFYNQGTLVASFYNTNKDLVWEGVWKDAVDDSAAKRDKTTPKNVKKLMKAYPVKPVKK